MRFASAAAMLAATSLLNATPAAAQTLADGYVATPSAPTKLVRFTTRGTPWFQRGGAFVAPHAPERAPQVCAMVAKKVGRLASFTVAGQPLAPDDLATCNHSAS